MSTIAAPCTSVYGVHLPPMKLQFNVLILPQTIDRFPCHAPTPSALAKSRLRNQQ
jgi:hypothetical protein